MSEFQENREERRASYVDWLIDHNLHELLHFETYSTNFCGLGKLEKLPKEVPKKSNRCMKIHKISDIENCSQTKKLNGKKCHLRWKCQREGGENWREKKRKPSQNSFIAKCIIIIKWCTHIFIIVLFIFLPPFA